MRRCPSTQLRCSLTWQARRLGRLLHPLWQSTFKACIAQLFSACAGEKLRCGAHLAEGRDDEPPYFDSFAEFKEFCVQYRSRLAHIVRLTAGWLPEQVPPPLCSGGHMCDAQRAATVQGKQSTGTPRNCLLPQALSGASRRLEAAVSLASSGSDLQTQERALDTAVHFLEAVVTAVCDVHLNSASAQPPGDNHLPSQRKRCSFPSRQKCAMNVFMVQRAS